MNKLFVTLISMVLFAAPVFAVNVEVNENALSNTPERLGIDLKAVSSYAVERYEHDKRTADKKAAVIFEKNVVSSSVRTAEIKAKDTDDESIYRAGNIEFRVAKATGSEALINLDRYAIAEKLSTPLPSEAIVRQTAFKYVQGNMPDVKLGDLRLSRILKIMDAESESSESGEISRRNSHVANYIVIFERMLNNIPVLGPGEKVRIYLSAQGDVIGHSKVWRKISEDYRRGRAIPTQEILEHFIARHANDRADKIVVNQVQFGFLAEGRFARQESLGPVYMISYAHDPTSKKMIELFDAFTGELVTSHENAGYGDVK